MCPICREQSKILWLKSKSEKSLIEFKPSGKSNKNFDIYECSFCDLKYVYPTPPSPDILSGYENSADVDFVSQHRGRLKTFSRYIKRIPTQTNMDYSNLKFLDVGCASGSFLAAAKKMGAMGVGLELNSFLADWGRKNYGVDIIQGSLESFHFNDTYNCVTFWDVLEHLQNPLQAIESVAKNLPIGGLLIFSLPDTDSFYSKYLRRFWPMILDVHLTYFNNKSLSFLVSKFGFKLKYRSNYYQTLDLRYLLYRLSINLNSSVILQFIKIFSFILTRINVTYYIGQKFYIFEKTSD